MERRLRMGMIGGGRNGFIGAIHRSAAALDHRIELVCGCFSRDPETTRISAEEYFVPNERSYENYTEMILQEAKLPPDQRMDFVSIVTPNVDHFAPAMLALESGFDVVIEKPITYSLDEAKQLEKKVKDTGRILALTHVYAGYPAVKEARERVLRGDFGEIRKVCVEYMQGWLSQPVESDPKSNAGWRTDPERSGIAGCMGDIGTHALHLGEYISGLICEEICADLHAFVEGRRLDDDGAALLRFNNGARGVLMASQVAAGEENNLKVRIYGEQGGVEWAQQEPNSLYIKWPDRPMEVIRIGNGYLSEAAQANSRTPGGHPEGYLGAFANIYRNFACTVDARRRGLTPRPEWLDFPTVEEGVRGMQFIEAIVEAGNNDQRKWVKRVR